MTSGERMVWAAEFVNALKTQSAEDAAMSATAAVWLLQNLYSELPQDGEIDTHASMLAEMLERKT
jgi:hypothetical protein